ncbi:MAG: hypothetical protein IMZ62_01965 [Chloroflexi bacterium]|nr:hypothetical protein [Chloroflexota bacterium]
MTTTRDFDFTFTVRVEYTPAQPARPGRDPDGANFSVPGEPSDIEISLVGDDIPQWLRGLIEDAFIYNNDANAYFFNQMEQSQ